MKMSEIYRLRIWKKYILLPNFSRYVTSGAFCHYFILCMYKIALFFWEPKRFTSSLPLICPMFSAQTSTMGLEKYGISTYGKVYLIDEGIEIPSIRYIYILANVLMLLGATIIVTYQYLSHRKTIYNLQKRVRASNSVNKAHGSLTPFFIAFMVNNLIRGSHMIDHICRPVYYHEPKWAYEKIWITEMEVPTYANVFVQGLGLLAILKVMKALIESQEDQLVKSLIYMALFIPASAFNIIHYTIEPPSNYGPFPNFNIAGSALSTIPLVVLIIYVSKTFEPIVNTESSERLLKTSDDESEKLARESTQTRKRSRTPVKN